MRRLAPIAALFAVALSATSAMAASERFAIEYRVERAAATSLDLATCLATAQKASVSVGWAPSLTKTYPGQLAMFASGPKAGGASLTVYCIAVDRKTAYVVQALDYARPQSPVAKRVADAVHQALLRASR